jgi:hypothetical protein
MLGPMALDVDRCGIREPSHARNGRCTSSYQPEMLFKDVSVRLLVQKWWFGAVIQ